LRVFENRMLRRIFGPKRKEVVGGWRKLHNEELPNMHSIRVFKPWSMRWTYNHRWEMGNTNFSQKI